MYNYSKGTKFAKSNRSQIGKRCKANLFCVTYPNQIGPSGTSSSHETYHNLE